MLTLLSLNMDVLDESKNGVFTLQDKYDTLLVESKSMVVNVMLKNRKDIL